MRNIFEHVLLKLELLIVTIENVVKAGVVSFEALRDDSNNGCGGG